jgi:hypothetical protein
MALSSEPVPELVVAIDAAVAEVLRSQTTSLQITIDQLETLESVPERTRRSLAATLRTELELAKRRALIEVLRDLVPYLAERGVALKVEGRKRRRRGSPQKAASGTQASPGGGVSPARNEVDRD